MLTLLRKIFSPGAEVDIRPIVLARFLKPRSLSRAAPGWPDALTGPIVQDLLRRKDILPLGPAEQFDACCTVPQLKEMLRAHGLRLDGIKGVLIQRLLDASVDPPTNHVKYLCSDAGRARAISWQEQRAAALERGAAKTLKLLKAHRVAKAIAQVRAVNEVWPSMDDVAVRFNPLAIKGRPGLYECLVDAALSGAPGILRDVSADDLARLRLAVAIWIAGLPVPGVAMAIVGYVGGSRFAAERAQMLLYHYVRNVCHLRDLRSLSITEAIVSFYAPCPACSKLNGKTYTLDAMPELPNPDCQADVPCTFIVRPWVKGFS